MGRLLQADKKANTQALVTSQSCRGASLDGQHIKLLSRWATAPQKAQAFKHHSLSNMSIVVDRVHQYDHGVPTFTSTDKSATTVQ